MPKKPIITPQDRSIFRKAMAHVTPLGKKSAHVAITPKKPAVHRAAQPPQRPEITLRDAADDTTPPLSAEAALYFAKPGPSLKTLRHLKQGQCTIEASLDLHGNNIDEARHALVQFISACSNHHQRWLHVIHGKGHRAQTDKPILKNLVNIWLRQIKQVLAFCSAQPKDGGTGAVYILLRSNKGKRL